MSQCHVVAGVLCDSQGRTLIAQRLPGTHMAGRWEFPGGKLKDSEQRRSGLVRELREELGIAVSETSPLIRLRHSYPEGEVLLDFWRVHAYHGEPVGAEGQALRWVDISQLHDVDLLDADRPVINALTLPDRYAITRLPTANMHNFTEQIATAARRGASMIQLRAPDIDAAQLHALAVAAVQGARGGAILINGDPRTTVSLALTTGAAGVHLPARFLQRLPATIPDGLLIGASCHNAEELELAARNDAHFAVLGSVLATPSHPGVVGLGWDRFAALVDQANLPVYAIGGVGPDDIERAQWLGAQGVAGISAFFD
ncbi:MAG: Nudix family hydrolase [Gammaproteobacteria bacterium]|nr:Nudix family hydrolase [Gammaproteobacteria bacterium]MDH3767076.1 Nudix family hydrolase [Gammaproteobacteria bacterium]